MDAFYASVEQLDNPALRGKPVIVGGPSRRGVVTAASYEVRPFGVRSAMPMAEALRLCPHAIVVPGRGERYAEISHSVFEIFRRYTPLVEGLSLDEAFLDVTASRGLFGDGETIARSIKNAIRNELGLTASAGVAPAKFIAKIASDLRKPDGLVVVRPDEVREFLRPLAIERMWGIGAKTAPKLRAAGFATFGDLAASDERTLERTLGRWGTQVAALARGEDSRDVVANRAPKSIGAEETFEHDLTRREDLEHALLGQTTRIAQRMVHEGYLGSTVVVKVKYADFTVASRRVQLSEPVADTDTIFGAARELLDRFDLAGARVRLTGVSMTDLARSRTQTALFPDPRIEKRDKLERLTAALNDRYGDGAVQRAALVEKGRRQ